MAKIKFDTNIPVTLSLHALEGEVVESQFGGNQIKFSAHEGPFWVSEAVGSILVDQIRKKKIPAHTPVEVCRREMAQGNGRKGIHWTIDTVGFVPGEQPDGTFALPAPSPRPPAPNNGANGVHPPAPPAAIASQPVDCAPNGSAPAPGNGSNGANGHAPAPSTLVHSGWAGNVRDQTQTLIDVFADCLRYASRHEGLIKSEDVRSLLLSAFINVGKNGGGKC